MVSGVTQSPTMLHRPYVLLWRPECSSDIQSCTQVSRVTQAATVFLSLSIGLRVNRHIQFTPGSYGRNTSSYLLSPPHFPPTQVLPPPYTSPLYPSILFSVSYDSYFPPLTSIHIFNHPHTLLSFHVSNATQHISTLADLSRLYLVVQNLSLEFRVLSKKPQYDRGVH